MTFDGFDEEASMKKSRFVEFFTDNTVLCLLGLALFLLHMFTNHRYGFHQDEMVVVDNAYHLAWGYVEYPPLTPFLARLSISLFGLTLVSARMFSALAQSIAMVLAGLMARELGGKRMAQVVAALVAAGREPDSLTLAVATSFISRAEDSFGGISRSSTCGCAPDAISTARAVPAILLLGYDPYGEGWMVRIRISDASEKDALMDAASYEATLG